MNTKLNMPRYILIVSLLLFGANINSFAQNIQTSTLEWSCNSTTVSGQAGTSFENTRIVTSPEQVVWYDQNGAIRKTLSVVRMDGEWNDISDDGSIMIYVKASNNTATIFFSKSYGSTMINIKNLESAESPTYDLNVTTINTL